jgi:hypothetical protein
MPIDEVRLPRHLPSYLIAGIHQAMNIGESERIQSSWLPVCKVWIGQEECTYWCTRTNLEPRNHSSLPSRLSNACIASRNSIFNDAVGTRADVCGRGNGVLSPVRGAGGGLRVDCKETPIGFGRRKDSSKDGGGVASNFTKLEWSIFSTQFYCSRGLPTNTERTTPSNNAVHA